MELWGVKVRLELVASARLLLLLVLWIRGFEFFVLRALVFVLQ